MTECQASFAKHVRGLMDEYNADTPIAVPRSRLNDACTSAYPQLAGAPTRMVSAYVCANLKSLPFLEAIQCPQSSGFRGLLGRVHRMQMEIRGMQRVLARIMREVSAEKLADVLGQRGIAAKGHSQNFVESDAREQ